MFAALNLFLQGIEVLEGALHKSPFEIVTTEPFLFNLCKLTFRANRHPLPPPAWLDRDSVS